MAHGVAGIELAPARFATINNGRRDGPHQRSYRFAAATRAFCTDFRIGCGLDERASSKLMYFGQADDPAFRPPRATWLFYYSASAPFGVKPRSARYLVLLCTARRAPVRNRSIFSAGNVMETHQRSAELPLRDATQRQPRACHPVADLRRRN